MTLAHANVRLLGSPQEMLQVTFGSKAEAMPFASAVCCAANCRLLEQSTQLTSWWMRLTHTMWPAEFHRALNEVAN